MNAQPLRIRSYMRSRRTCLQIFLNRPPRIEFHHKIRTGPNENEEEKKKTKKRNGHESLQIGIRRHFRRERAL